MLGRLMKHEWKSTYKAGCLMLFATLLVSFFGWLAFQSPMWHNMENSRYRINILDLMSLFTIVMYVMLLVGVAYGILIYLAVHFYKTMYTAQGYLTHTLPVTKHQILGSKILVGGLWMFMITLGMLLSVVILISSLLSAVMPAGYSLAEAWREILNSVGELAEFLKYELNVDIGSSLLMGVIYMLLTPFTTVTILFGAISAGQFFTKFRVLMAIVCYIGIMVVNSLLSSLIQNIVIIQTSFTEYMDVTMTANVVLNLLMAVGLYVVSWLVISKKLNME